MIGYALRWLPFGAVALLVGVAVWRLVSVRRAHRARGNWWRIPVEEPYVASPYGPGEDAAVHASRKEWRFLGPMGVIAGAALILGFGPMVVDRMNVAADNGTWGSFTPRHEKVTQVKGRLHYSYRGDWTSRGAPVRTDIELDDLDGARLTGPVAAIDIGSPDEVFRQNSPTVWIMAIPMVVAVWFLGIGIASLDLRLHPPARMFRRRRGSA